MRIACFYLMILAAKPIAAQEFKLDNWEFDWKLQKIGDKSLIIRKDAESTRVIIGASIHALSMTPEEAVIVGKTLKQTTDKAKNMKGTKGKSERAIAGKHVVTFQTTDEGSFFVSIRKDERFSIASVILDREDAIAFAPLLVEAKDRASYLDKEVTPGESATRDPAQVEKAAQVAKARAEKSRAEADQMKADAEREKSASELATAQATKLEKQKDVVRMKEDLESSAGKKLALAKSLLSKDKAIGMKRLKEIVEQFEGTEAAEQARELLKK